MRELFRLERASQPLTFNGERLTTDEVSRRIEVEHLHRYFIGRELCHGKDVLDVASGEGYGAALLAQVAGRVVGMEIDAESVAHASRSYSRENLCFVQGDARFFPLRDASFDVVVSFETLEHFAEHQRFLREIKRVLKPDGVLVISTPDRSVFSPADKPPNPYHVRELERDEFRSTLTEHFSEVCVYAQRAFAGSALATQRRTVTDDAVLIFEKRDANHIESDCGLPRAPFLVAIASDQRLNNRFSASLYISRTESETSYDIAHDSHSETMPVQVYPFGTKGYSEHASIEQRVRCEMWETAIFDLPDGLGRGPLRIDPADCPCVIQIGRIAVRSTQTGEDLWGAESPSALHNLTTGGSCALLPNPNGCFVLSYGKDPHITLPAIETPIRPVRVEVLLHISKNPAYIYQSVELHTRTMHDEVRRSASELKGSHNERMLIAAELKRVASERNEVRRELARALEAIGSGHAREIEGEQSRRRLQSELEAAILRFDNSLIAQRELDAEKTSLEEQLTAERQLRAALERSASWRATKPIRTFMNFIRTHLR